MHGFIPCLEREMTHFTFSRFVVYSVLDPSRTSCSFCFFDSRAKVKKQNYFCHCILFVFVFEKMEQEDESRILRLSQFTSFYTDLALKIDAPESKSKSKSKSRNLKIVIPREKKINLNVAVQAARYFTRQSSESNMNVLRNKARYVWWSVNQNQEEDFYPPHIDDSKEKFPEREDHSLLCISDIHTVFYAAEAALHAVSLFPRYSDLKSVPILGSRKIEISQVWPRDEFFGYLRFNGPNPTMLHRIFVWEDLFLKTKFSRSNLGELKRLFPDVNFVQEAKNGNVFYEDYYLLDNLRQEEDKRDYLCIAPIILYLRKSDKITLLPIAIQLVQDIKDDSKSSLTTKKTSFFPDPKQPHAWTYAKTAANTAYFLYHEIVSHLLLTH